MAINSDLRNKLYFIAIALVLLGSAIGGWYIFQDNVQADVEKEPVLVSEVEGTSMEPRILEVNLIINYGNSEDIVFDEEVGLDTTAMGLLAKAAQANNIQVEYQQFDFGRLVQKIGDVTGDSKHFWGFYVNGVMANVGADSYVLNAGDSVAFRYVEM